LKRLVLALVLLLLAGGMASSLPAKASNDSLWVNNKRLNVNFGGAASTAAEIAGQPCFQTTFKIKRFTHGGVRNGQSNWKIAPDQEKQVCAVQSGIGLIAHDLGGTYVQFPGSAYAVRIHSNASNFIVTVIPVPGSRTVIVQTKTSTSFSPAATYIFYNLLGVGEITISGGEAVYYIRSFPQRFVDQHNKTLEMFSLAFSSDGEWMMAVVRGAVMRIHVPTKNMQTVTKVLDRTNYQLAVSNDGRYAFVGAIQSGSSSPKLYDLLGCQSNKEYDLGRVPDLVTGCTQRDITTELQNSIGGFRTLLNVSFSYDSQVLRATATHREASSGPISHTGVTIVKEDYLQPKSKYLALGDSFSSGEGDTEGGTWYEPGTDTSKNKCHVSRRSYPYLVAEQLGLHDGPNKSPVDNSPFHSVACSGAKNEHVLSQTQRPSESPSIWLAGSNRQLHWVDRYDPKSATISIIGNDIGFDDKLKRCLGPDTCFNSYEERVEVLQEIRGKFNDLVHMYETLKDASPGVRIYALGYPQLIDPTGNCAANVHLNQTEGQMANDLVQFLNFTIKAAAEKAGVMYIDVENAFSGRRLCEAHTQFLAVNGLTAGNDKLLLIGNESFHPNQVGQQRMAERVIQQTGGLVNVPAPANPTAQAPDPFSEKFAGFFRGYKHQDRQVYSLMNDDELAQDVIVRLLQQQAETEAPSGGSYELWINSEPVYLGTFTPDENGILHLDFTIPESVEPGFHTLHLYGKNASGEDVDIYKTIYVAASETDYDGDGIANEEDSCAAFEPSGIDEDQDGIDDVCDNFIDELPEGLPETPLSEEPKPPEDNSETVAGDQELPLPPPTDTSSSSQSQTTLSPRPSTPTRQPSIPAEGSNPSEVLASATEPVAANQDQIPSMATVSSTETQEPTPKSKSLPWPAIAFASTLLVIVLAIWKFILKKPTL
jgi:lysophospholipase L1-like esterase